VSAFVAAVAEIKKSRPGLSKNAAWAEGHRLYPDLYAKAREEGVS
jgi:hypothetical protein